MNIDTGSAYAEAEIIVMNMAKKVRLARRVQRQSLALERSFADLSKCDDAREKFCDVPSCLAVIPDFTEMCDMHDRKYRRSHELGYEAERFLK